MICGGSSDNDQSNLGEATSEFIACDATFHAGLASREFGRDAVTFALAIDPGSSLSDIEWTPARLKTLEHFKRAILVDDFLRPGQQTSFGTTFGWKRQDSFLRSMRQFCGGSLPSIDEGIPEIIASPVRLLMRLINRYEIDLKAKLATGQNAMRLSPNLYMDPDARNLQDEVLDDPKGARLVRALGPKIPNRPRSCRVFTRHSILNLTADAIPEDLVSACATRTLANGDPFNAESMRNHAEKVMEDFFALVGGEVVALPLAVGSMGSRLILDVPAGDPPSTQDVQRVAVGDGYFRPVTENDRKLFPMASDPLGAVWVTSEDSRVEFEQIGTTERPFEADNKVWESVRDGLRDPHDNWETIVQAAVLSAPTFPPPAWQLSDFFPTGLIGPPSGIYSRRGLAISPAVPEVNIRDLVEIEEWYEKLNSQPTALRVSRSRLVSALISRPDPVDALVDAVVAWEGIFSGTPETQMRTVLPSCKILAKPDEVNQVLKSMKQVYSLRSQLVHGAPRKKRDDPDSVIEARDKSLQWVTALLRYLFSEAPDLLALSASARSEAVLLPGSQVTAKI